MDVPTPTTMPKPKKLHAYSEKREQRERARRVGRMGVGTARTRHIVQH